jgi:hypothetical protein
VPYTTTLSAASAAVQAIRAMREEQVQVRSLQEWHQTLKVHPLSPKVRQGAVSKRNAS